MFTVRKLVLLALFAASALALQVSLSFLPNVELVTLWFLLLACVLTFKESLVVVFVFSTLEALVWGFGDWVVAYLWIWALWVVLVQAFKSIIKDSSHGWALLGAFYGFAFGLLFSIQHAVLYGFNMGVIYWIRGISFDIIHAFSNYSLILILYKPLSKLLSTLLRKWG
jgi:hypothetical protein